MAAVLPATASVAAGWVEMAIAGGSVTVRVAPSLVALPAELVTTTE